MLHQCCAAGSGLLPPDTAPHAEQTDTNTQSQHDALQEVLSKIMTNSETVTVNCSKLVEATEFRRGEQHDAADFMESILQRAQRVVGENPLGHVLLN